jgi:hypothetical protein
LGQLILEHLRSLNRMGIKYVRMIRKLSPSSPPFVPSVSRSKNIVQSNSMWVSNTTALMGPYTTESVWV